MNRFLLSIAITFLIIFALCVIFYLRAATIFCKFKKKKSLEKMIPKLKTGDIIFVRNDYLFEKNIIKFLTHNVLYTSLTNILYTHACIIIKIDGVPYVYTSINSQRYDNISGKYKNGAVLLNIYDYLKRYPGDIICYSIKKEIVSKNVDFLGCNMNKSFPPNYSVVFNAGLGTDVMHHSDKIFCVEAVLYAMILLGIINDSILPHRYDVLDLVNIVKKSKKYEKPILIKNSYYYSIKMAK